MINPVTYQNCSEFYEIVKTVEFVMRHGGEDMQFRIEALHDVQAKRYSTRVSYHQYFRLQPSYPIVGGSFANNPEDISLWVPFPNAAWTDRDTAEGAIEQALGFLGAN
ncbi:hypothetical protein D9M69_558070 [compost metagenome]